MQDIAAKMKKRGGASAGLQRHLAGRLDGGGGFDEAAEILLVQMAAGDRLHGSLQFGEREGRRHQLEDHRPIFHLGAQPAHGRGQICDDDRAASARRAAAVAAALQRRLAPVAPGLLDEAGLIEQLIALERILLVEAAAVAAGTGD